MRNTHLGFLSVLAVASLMASNGCSSSSGGGDAGSGGKSSTGGSGGSSSASSLPNCPNGSTCGGDVVGTWDVTSSCLTFSGDMDTMAGSLGCPKLPVTGTLEVTGTWTAKSNGSYVDKTITKGKIAFTLAPDCLTVSKAPVECVAMKDAFTTLGWNGI